VRESGSDNYTSNNPIVNPHSPSVSIQELREAERRFHQRQCSAVRRSQVIRQRRVYAVATHRNTPSGRRPSTSNVRDTRQRSRSRSRPR